MGALFLQPSDAGAWLADDPLLTWLARWGAQAGFQPDVPGALDFGAFVGERAAAFEQGVLRLLEQRSTVVQIAATGDRVKREEETKNALQNGAEIVYGSSLHDGELGVRSSPTFLVRSDVLLRLFPSALAGEIAWRRDYDRPLSAAEIAVLVAPSFAGSFHYRVLDVRFAGLQLDRRGHLGGNARLWLENRALALLQGLEPPCAFLLGRSVTQGATTERSCWERLGPAFQNARWKRGTFGDAVTEALSWVRRVDVDGAGWRPDKNPTVPELRPNLKNTDDAPWRSAKHLIATTQGELTALWQVGVELRDRALAGGVPDGQGGCRAAVRDIDDDTLSAERLGVTGPSTIARLDAMIALRRRGAAGWSLGGDADHDPAWQKPAPVELYVDFETVNDLDDDCTALPWRGGQPLIVMAGVGWLDPPEPGGAWNFRCFVVDALDVAAEGRMLDAFFACIDERKRAAAAGADGVRVFHWSPAEESMLDTSLDSARSRHPGRRWPRVAWFDFLDRVVKRAPFVVRGADGFGLKTIGKALHAQGLITTSWQAGDGAGDGADVGPADGLTAMVATWRAAAIARAHGIRLAEVPLMRDVAAYNEVDCRVMAEVIAFVRGAARQPGSAAARGGLTPLADTSPASPPVPRPTTTTAAVSTSPALRGPMKILSPGERPFDELVPALADAVGLDVATPALSLPALAQLQPALKSIRAARLLLPGTSAAELQLWGGDGDRAWRNRLEQRVTARRLADWIASCAQVRVARPVPQALTVVTSSAGPRLALTGTASLTTGGLGLTPPDASFVQVFAGPECAAHASWFDGLWDRTAAAGASAPDGPASEKDHLLQTLRDFDAPVSPAFVYFLVLQQLFGSRGDDLDEDRVVNAATGIKDTAIWRKLFRFQRDGVIGAIDKLQKYGGCIVADSVGLGKTFEALAVIKYYELRNSRVLVLCPKRLRDNWTLYKANDQRNVLADDRLHYDVLNHTDLTRESGFSGDIDLSNVKWSNYDLVVIDESHNFRNRPANKGRKTRYEHLLETIVKTGVKTRVLMLSATPVNNRLADLKNQILFATEGADGALVEQGIGSIERTTRLAQQQFNRWLDLDDGDRSSTRLIEMLGFDYFKLLDLLTIARSRKHIERYYGTSETGRFPERLKPVNITADVDNEGAEGTRTIAGTDVEIATRSVGEFASIKEINNEIRRLNLSAYSPLKYVLPGKRAAYDAKYATSKDGKQLFAQGDREQSLIHLLRVNLLKRMESAVTSFKLTLERQLHDVDVMLEKLKAHEGAVSFWGDEASIADIDVEDPDFEAVLVGAAVKVSLHDIDKIRWQQDLEHDRERLARLLAAAGVVSAARDDKLQKLKSVIADKIEQPINDGNRKVIVFSAFADTAHYLFENIAAWAQETYGLHCALVTGGGRNRVSLPGLRADLSSILTAFSPRSKDRPAALAGEGEVDILIATDCISEGQNLQDCDTLINYDIHWNPVRVIQRFGRIDRIGSKNRVIQMINFWPNLELDEYIDLERRVTARMTLVDVSATGEENLFDAAAMEPGSPGERQRMNDLEYRRRQLLQLKEEVIDLEDLKNGVSISDLTLNDFRLDLGRFKKEEGDVLSDAPFGIHAVITAGATAFGRQDGVESGVIFCLRACGKDADQLAEPGYPLSPHFVVHVVDPPASDGGSGDGTATVLPYTQAKQVLERMKRLCLHQSEPDLAAVARFDKQTKQGVDMALYQRRLATAVAAITGKKEERAVASLFSAGPTHAKKGDFAGAGDFEVIAFLVVLPAPATTASPGR